MNNLALQGRLTRDPEMRYMQSGTAQVTFTLAVRRDFKNQAGEYESDFFNCVAWAKTAEFIAEHFKKGNGLVISNGRLQSRKWQAQDGTNRYSVEVIADRVEFPLGNAAGSKEEASGVAGLGEEIIFDDNELPF